MVYLILLCLCSHILWFRSYFSYLTSLPELSLFFVSRQQQRQFRRGGSIIYYYVSIAHRLTPLLNKRVWIELNLKWIELIWIESNQIKSNQIKSNGIESNWIELNWIVACPSHCVTCHDAGTDDGVPIKCDRCDAEYTVGGDGLCVSKYWVFLRHKSSFVGYCRQFHTVEMGLRKKQNKMMAIWYSAPFCRMHATP